MVLLFKRLSAAILFAMLVAECSKDEAIVLCQITVYKTMDGPDTVTNTFVYNAHRLMSRSTVGIGYSSILNYHYNLDGVIDYAVGETNGLTGRINYNYGLNNQLAQSASIYGTDTILTVFNYNDQGQLIEKIQFYAGAASRDTTKVDYLYPDLITRNPSSTIQTGNSTITTLYQYDTKINPFREMFPSIQTSNNIVRIESTGPVTTISYAYNELGYPVAATWSSGPTLSYKYSCDE